MEGMGGWIELLMNVRHDMGVLTSPIPLVASG